MRESGAKHVSRGAGQGFSCGRPLIPKEVSWHHTSNSTNVLIPSYWNERADMP